MKITFALVSLQLRAVFLNYLSEKDGQSTLTGKSIEKIAD